MSESEVLYTFDTVSLLELMDDYNYFYDKDEFNKRSLERSPR